MTATVLGCAVLPAHGQQTPFRGSVDLAQIDVSALDSDRRPVKGLTAADFTVLENGKPAPIVSFEAVEIPPVATDSALWTREAGVDVVTNDSPTRRVVLIVLDDADTGFAMGEMPVSKRIANAVIDHMGPEDLGAVTFTESGRRQDITTDHQKLRQAIDSFVAHRGSGGVGLACRYRGKFASPFACVLDTLVNAGIALANAPPQGRKTLVFISPGVPFDFSMRDGRGADIPETTIEAIGTTLRNLQAANVNVYGVDPRGAMAGIIGAASNSLRMFSEETGGRATLANNTPWDAVSQIFSENSSYYMLAIRSATPGSNDTFRRIQVKVNRPGVDVRTRSGYFVPGTKTTQRAKPVAPETPLTKALSKAVPNGDLPLGLSLAPFAVPGAKNAAVAVMLSVREPLPASQPVDIETVALDADCGDCRKLPEQRETVSPPSSSSHFETLQWLSLPAGRYEIRVAATSGERAGAVFAHVDVPHFAKERLSASGLVLAAAPSAPSAQATPFSSLIPVAPTAWREFSPAISIAAFLRLYQHDTKHPAAVRISATIRDESDRINFSRTTFIESGAFSSAGVADYQLELPVRTLEAGRHLLTIDAYLGDSAVRRDARFTVR